jgi:hypothetical protein
LCHHENRYATEDDFVAVDADDDNDGLYYISMLLSAFDFNLPTRTSGQESLAEPEPTAEVDSAGVKVEVDNE